MPPASCNKNCCKFLFRKFEQALYKKVNFWINLHRFPTFGIITQSTGNNLQTSKHPNPFRDKNNATYCKVAKKTNCWCNEKNLIKTKYLFLMHFWVQLAYNGLKSILKYRCIKNNPNWKILLSAFLFSFF